VLYDDYVYDVELEKYHTLFIRRGGRVTVSGNCRCLLRHLPKGYKWDEEIGKFTLQASDLKYKRKSKAVLKVGDKEFLV
jgi:hypothetical protein